MWWSSLALTCFIIIIFSLAIFFFLPVVFFLLKSRLLNPSLFLWPLLWSLSCWGWEQLCSAMYPSLFLWPLLWSLSCCAWDSGKSWAGSSCALHVCLLHKFCCKNVLWKYFLSAAFIQFLMSLQRKPFKFYYYFDKFQTQSCLFPWYWHPTCSQSCWLMKIIAGSGFIGEHYVFKICKT